MNKYFKYLALVLLVSLSKYVSAQVEEIGSKNSLFYYSGTLGKAGEVEFNLQMDEPEVSGSYIVEKTGDWFLFNGRLSPDKDAMGVLVYSESNEYVASIEAYFVSDENSFAKEINGVWKSADGRVRRPINLKKVAELAATANTDRPHAGE